MYIPVVGFVVCNHSKASLCTRNVMVAVDAAGLYYDCMQPLSRDSITNTVDSEFMTPVSTNIVCDLYKLHNITAYSVSFTFTQPYSNYFF